MSSISYSKAQGREIRAVLFFRLQDWVFFQSSPRLLQMRWGWGARRLVVIWACTFFPPPVLGIPENSFQPNPKRALSGFKTMTGNTGASGGLLALEGNGILQLEFGPSCPHVPQVSYP